MEDSLPNNFISHGFFFPRSTADELVELGKFISHYGLEYYVGLWEFSNVNNNDIYKKISQ